MEGLSQVPPHPRHHLEPLPVPAEEVEGPGTHAISLQDLQAPGPVQGVVRLVQVQKDRVKYLLHHGHNLLEQFDLEGGGTRTSTRLEPMKRVFVGDGGGEVAIENHRHRLPHHFQDTYATVVYAPFWD